MGWCLCMPWFGLLMMGLFAFIGGLAILAGAEYWRVS